MKLTRRLASITAIMTVLALVSVVVTASEFPTRQLDETVLLGADGDSTRIVPVRDAQPTGNWVIHYDPNTPQSEKWEYVNRIGGTLVERIAELEIWVVGGAGVIRRELHL